METGVLQAVGEPTLWVILTIIDLYTWIVFLGVILSWLVHFNIINTQNQFVFMVGDFTHRFTEPILRPIRSFLPNFGGIDISPVILIIGLIFLKKVVYNLYAGI